MFLSGFTKLVRNYFGFSRTEMRGALVLVVILFFVVTAPLLYRKWLANKPMAEVSVQDQQILDSLVSLINIQHSLAEKVVLEPNSSPREIVLENFDPNLANLEQLELLGFESGIAQRIINFREAGGSFKIKADLLKIYGLPRSTFLRVYDYINLPEAIALSEKAEPHVDLADTKEIIEVENSSVLDLNKADTIALKKLPGIGSTFSIRIIKYRELLGGFTHYEQLSEIYGLEEEHIEKIKGDFFIDPGYSPQLININKSNLKELMRHPYINFEIAKAMVNHRKKYGLYTSIEDLKEIITVEEDEWERIFPYLTI